MLPWPITSNPSRNAWIDDVEDLDDHRPRPPAPRKADRRYPRHGARIRLISDGDLSAGISAAVIGTGVHAVMGTGGAPEGVLTAAALRCLNGEILARLVVEARARRAYRTDGNQGPEADLQDRRTRPGQENYFRVHRRNRRQPAARRAFLRRRHSHPLVCNSLRTTTGQVRFIIRCISIKRDDIKVVFYNCVARVSSARALARIL